MNKTLTFKEKLLKSIKKQKKKTIGQSFLALLVVTLSITGLSFLNKPAISKVQKEENLIFTGTMVGDMMFGRHVEKVSSKYGEEALFQYVKPYLESSDYVTGNFENPVTLQDDYPKADKYIHLSTKAQSVTALKNLNFSVLNFANNHAMDFGEQGLIDTLQTFEDHHLDVVGAGRNLEEAKNKISYQKINDLTVATLGFTDAYVKGFSALENSGGILPADPELFMPLIAKAKQQANLVVVHMHWGQEYDNEPQIRQKQMAKAIADSGADIIIGHHPHVLSSVEIYNNTLIAYSLGNFVFDQGWSRTRDSTLLQYKLYKSGKAAFEFIPLRIREAQPTPLTGKTDWIHREKIVYQLTKGVDKESWYMKDNNLVFEVDHSEVLKGSSYDE
jgi:gamma-polyglutamate biosynthesis protein CapA